MAKLLKRGSTFKDAAKLLVQAETDTVASTDHVDPEALSAMIKEVFNRFDSDGSGYLDRQEMQSVFSSLLPKFTKKQILYYSKQLDRGGDGQVSHSEFMEWLQEDTPESKEVFAAVARETSDAMVGRVREVFKRFDTDGGGFLDKDELSRVFRTFDSNFTMQDIDALIKDLDRGGDGKVSRREFLTWIKTGSPGAKSVSKAILSQTGEKQEARIKKAFDKYDATGDGSLDMEELRKTLQALGSFSNDEIVKVCADLDKSKDGEISFEEFRDWIKDGTGPKAAAKAKAILAPSDNDGLEAVFYNFCGAGHQDMDGKSLKRLCQDCGLFDKNFKATVVDLIFSDPKVKPKDRKCMDFFQFEVAMELIADKKGVSKADVRTPMLMQGGPNVKASPTAKVSNVTKPMERKTKSLSSGALAVEKRIAAILRAPAKEAPGEESWRRNVDNGQLWRIFGAGSDAGNRLKVLYNPPAMKPVDDSFRHRTPTHSWSSPFLTQSSSRGGYASRPRSAVLTAGASSAHRPKSAHSHHFPSPDEW